MELKHTAQRQGRLASFLKEDMGMSTGLVNKLKWQNKIFVNGAPQHNDYTVQPGDVITAALDEPTPEYPAEAGELTILFEDDHILAVDKPAGMLIHPSRATMTGTLANRVVAYYQKTGQKSAFHPITRLDRDTFGIVLLAKNAHIHALLNDLHKEGNLQKTYHALVLGQMPQKEGIIDAPIARRPLPSLLRYVSPEGKPSVTQYRVLEQTGEVSRLALCPITGRTHQLRVHCAYLGCPILGDPQYGNEQSRKGFSSQMLCAKRLEFTHPITGENLVLQSQLDV
ncbi:MAG: RluA family pseudouridine synthase [Oscillospiraceae bacterium]|nr:RluA family pseudouridine synthase [Oscillospiraceae bacterium]